MKLLWFLLHFFCLLLLLFHPSVARRMTPSEEERGRFSFPVRSPPPPSASSRHQP